jgi:hypothetical protein
MGTFYIALEDKGAFLNGTRNCLPLSDAKWLNVSPTSGLVQIPGPSARAATRDCS